MAVLTWVLRVAKINDNPKAYHSVENFGVVEWT